MTERTDRELLELAARAQGWVYVPPYGCDPGGWTDPKDGKQHWADLWNPLERDGDALRLAVRMGFTINPYQEGVFVSRFEGEEVVAEPFIVMGQPDTAATRRAIVRAAAALGVSQ